MREKLDRLTEIRTVRLRQRQREVAAAEVAQREAALGVQRIETEIRTIRRQRTDNARFEPGERTGAAAFELRARTDEALKAQLRTLTRRYTVAKKGLEEREAALAAAREAARSAERSREQIETVAERVGREEALAAEIAEELQAEPTRPRRYDSGDPA